MALVGGKLIAGASELSTTLRRPNSLANGLAAKFDQLRVVRQLAATINRGRIVSNPGAAQGKPPVTAMERVFRAKFILLPTHRAVVRKRATEGPAIVRLYKARTGQVIAAGSVIVVRGPIDKERRVLAAIHTGIVLPSYLGGLGPAAAAADVPFLRQ